MADRYWSGPELTNVAWSYTDPSPAVGAITGRICFCNALVDLLVDELAAPRPVSPFSAARHRPGS